MARKDTGGARIEDLVRRWSRLSGIFGGEAAKRFRTEARRSATGIRGLADTLSDPGLNKDIWQDDIATIRAAANLLDRLGGEFEVAQRKCEKIRKDETARYEAERNQKIAEARQSIFGTSRDSQEVMSLASDALAFVNACPAWAKERHGTDSGYWPLDDDWRLGDAIRQGKVDVAANILSKNYLVNWTGTSRIYGKVANHDDGTTDWFAHWDDFIEWRSRMKDAGKGRT